MSLPCTPRVSPLWHITCPRIVTGRTWPPSLPAKSLALRKTKRVTSSSGVRRQFHLVTSAQPWIKNRETKLTGQAKRGFSSPSHLQMEVNGIIILPIKLCWVIALPWCWGRFATGAVLLQRADGGWLERFLRTRAVVFDSRRAAAIQTVKHAPSTLQSRNVSSTRSKEGTWFTHLSHKNVKSFSWGWHRGDTCRPPLVPGHRSALILACSLLTWGAPPHDSFRLFISLYYYVPEKAADLTLESWQASRLLAREAAAVGFCWADSFLGVSVALK